MKIGSYCKFILIFIFIVIYFDIIYFNINNFIVQIISYLKTNSIIIRYSNNSAIYAILTFIFQITRCCRNLKSINKFSIRTYPVSDFISKFFGPILLQHFIFYCYFGVLIMIFHQLVFVLKCILFFNLFFNLFLFLLSRCLFCLNFGFVFFFRYFVF